jgi:hypothetical protein
MTFIGMLKLDDPKHPRLEIREFYYKRNGSEFEILTTQERPIELKMSGKNIYELIVTVEESIDMLNHMKKAFKRPIIYYNDGRYQELPKFKFKR